MKQEASAASFIEGQQALDNSIDTLKQATLRHLEKEDALVTAINTYGTFHDRSIFSTMRTSLFARSPRSREESTSLDFSFLAHIQMADAKPCLHLVFLTIGTTLFTISLQISAFLSVILKYTSYDMQYEVYL